MNETLESVIKLIIVFFSLVLAYMLFAYLREWIFGVIDTKREENGTR